MGTRKNETVGGQKLEQIYFDTGCKKFKTEQNWAEITFDSDNDEDELEILSTFALAFVKDEKMERKKACS